MNNEICFILVLKRKLNKVESHTKSTLLPIIKIVKYYHFLVFSKELSYSGQTKNIRGLA
jgi:hypothetical protein